MILLQPPNWQPVEVRDPNTVKYYLNRGWKKYVAASRPVVSESSVPAASSGSPKTIKINSASLTELREIKGLGLVSAKKIQEARPISDISQLGEITEGRVDWTAFNIDYDYSVAEDES